ncbi:hypothetical protein Ahy_B07g087217 [Arachis hypogaea]|uniref:Uncharacterized protein n=1 Tax=Arachis hypogaea TaxID=3818 RepID=A0A444YBH7_ARAHY|nr:hypothetical protein Ahy_B07g087217 [Arachis hypogaea]
MSGIQATPNLRVGHVVACDWIVLQHRTYEDTANIVVYHNNDFIRNTYEGVSFACENTFLFVVPYTITFAKLQTEAYEGVNNDSDEEFKATYEAGDEDEDDDGGGEAVAETLVVPPAVCQMMVVPLFIRSLDLDAMHALELRVASGEARPALPKSRVADPEDGEIQIGIEYGSRRSVSWKFGVTLSLEESITLFTNPSHRRSMQNARLMDDHSKLDSDTIAEAMKPLVEFEPSIKVKSIIAEVQARFNYTISYRNAWLAKLKSIAHAFLLKNPIVLFTILSTLDRVNLFGG